VGAYGGRADIMEMVAPLGPVYQAGTLSGNPLAMAAGIATLQELRSNPGIYQQLEQRSQTLVDGVREAGRRKNVPLTANRVGSMFTWFFQPEQVWDWEGAEKSDTEAFGRFHRKMLDSGIYLPPSQFEAVFMSAAHTGENIQQTIAAAERALG